MLVKAFIGLLDKLLIKLFLTHPRFIPGNKQNCLTLRVEGKCNSPHTVIRFKA
jgi:hypothetical protein